MAWRDEPPRSFSEVMAALIMSEYYRCVDGFFGLLALAAGVAGAASDIIAKLLAFFVDVSVCLISRAADLQYKYSARTSFEVDTHTVRWIKTKMSANLSRLSQMNSYLALLLQDQTCIVDENWMIIYYSLIWYPCSVQIICKICARGV